MDVEKVLRKVTQSLSVSRAFGTAYEAGSTLVIPVAFVAGGGGAGEGTAAGSADDEQVDLENEDFDDDDVSSGSGGGFGGAVMPVGAYVVSDDNVRWVPAVNSNLVLIVGLLALRMLLRAFRAR